jgi:hypothetical protein
MTTREETLRRLQDPVSTANKHVVGVRGDKVIVMAPPSQLTAEEALVFAAWLVTMAECVQTDDNAPPFEKYLEAVKNT